jgi:hypothetical protein
MYSMYVFYVCILCMFIYCGLHVRMYVYYVCMLLMMLKSVHRCTKLRRREGGVTCAGDKADTDPFAEARAAKKEGTLKNKKKVL